MATPASAAELAQSYLGGPDSTLALLADAQLVLIDGELPVHAARLCYGVLEEAVGLVKRSRPTATKVLFRIPLPGCCVQDTAVFLQLLYSMKPGELARTMSLDSLMGAEQIAHRFHFTDTFAAVETGMLEKFYGKNWPQLSFYTSSITPETVFSLLSWAEAVHSSKVLVTCGAYIGMRPSLFKQCTHPKAIAFNAAIRASTKQGVTKPP